ncbi:Uma2 family endonuclease [Sulfurimonas sp.]|uniref:Uma2 family endonuclease n=1 Tax=Sulfurimonas sp. TaxID=2022749 RepID=UPI0019FB942A|nr:Uma2 family endonuclease [Sulfurimonas sp.]MBE0513955.1 Uma2 family endonuclease [Sulfurimonas sp.]
MGAIKLEDIPHYTYDDYKLWEGQWELINGVPYAMSPAPMIKHQSISNKIGRYLDEAFEGCKVCQALLPIDWKINEDTIVQPDNSVICHEPQNDAYITKAPKIIFEVLSKSTARKDTGIKFEIYEREGVEYYIIVNPDDKVAKVYHLKEGRYIKLMDASHEKVDFSIKECHEKVEFDFSKIW